MKNYKLSNHRKFLWKNNRDVMEEFRKKAIIVAKQKKEDKNENLKKFINNLPQNLTTEELKEKISKLNYGNKKRKYKIESLIKRLKRKNMIKFNYEISKWENLINE